MAVLLIMGILRHYTPLESENFKIQGVFAFSETENGISINLV